MASQPVQNRYERWFSNRRREFFLVAGVALVLIAALRLRTDTFTYDHPNFLNPWDHHKYIWMASNNPFDFHIAPFCWRVGTPLLAKALPFDIEKDFLVLSYLALWMTGVLMYYLARRFGFSKLTSLTGMVAFFSMGWAVKANLFNIFKPDPMAFLFTVLALLCVLDRRDLMYAIMLAVGVLFKESVLFVAPLYYTLRTQKLVDVRLLLRAAGLALPAVGVYFGLRFLIPMQNDDYFYLSTLPDALHQVQLGRSTYDLGWLWNEIGLERIRALSPESLAQYTVGSFGVVPALLPLFAIRKNAMLFVRFLPFLLLVYVQILFATNDTRLIVAGFPAIIIMALNGADSIAGTLRVNVLTLAAVFAAMVCLLLIRTWMLALPGIYEAILFIACLAFCFSRRQSLAAQSGKAP
ncbi:MAG: hypothetical protein PVF33_12895 [Candidatus Latescibacterota bacterium]